MCTDRTRSRDRLEITTNKNWSTTIFLAVIIFGDGSIQIHSALKTSHWSSYGRRRCCCCCSWFRFYCCWCYFFVYNKTTMLNFFPTLSLANWSILFYAILNYNYSVFSCSFRLAAYCCGYGCVAEWIDVLLFSLFSSLFLAIFSNRNRCEASLWVWERIRKLRNVRDEIHVRTIVLTFIIRPFLYLPLKHYSSVRQLIDSFFALFFFSLHYSTLFT